jgi:hypothetical protein
MIGRDVSPNDNPDGEQFITSVEVLRRFLHAAMQLEHATIPPYLVALYSLHPETNSDAFHVLRVVVVEEMLHLTLAANILNAVGGSPNLTVARFVPEYPTKLPDGETDFDVSLEPFSPAAVETFLNIERPGSLPYGASKVVHSSPEEGESMLAVTRGADNMRFYSIGEFYAAIQEGLDYLCAPLGAEKALFTGDESRQIRPEYYYSGGGEVIVVKDLKTASEAIRLISEQGEGLGGEIYGKEGELAHYFRFEQLKLGKYYQKGDAAGEPSGPPLKVDWDKVYPIKSSPVRLDEYPEGSETRKAVAAFNASYAGFLAVLTNAFNGDPELLIGAVPYMFRLREKMTQIMRNPMPGHPGFNAAATFEMPPKPGEAR